MGFDSHVGRIFELIVEKNEKIKIRNQVLRAPYVCEDSSVRIWPFDAASTTREERANNKSILAIKMRARSTLGI